jgi:ankyrin repeat protein
MVFKFIQRLVPADLKKHLEDTSDKYDVTRIFDRSGYSPLHFAAYKNSERMCEVLTEFILLLGDQKVLSEEERYSQKDILQAWVN